MSKAQITHEVVATIGTYKDRQTGEEKKRYTTIGKVFTYEDGSQSIKFETIPVGQEWSGWASIYPIRDKHERQNMHGGERQPQQTAHNAANSNGYQNQNEPDDNIPF